MSVKKTIWLIDGGWVSKALGRILNLPHAPLRTQIAALHAQAECETQINRPGELNFELIRFEAQLAAAAANL